MIITYVAITTFAMLDRFCLLPKPPPVLNEQYQAGWNTNQN